MAETKSPVVVTSLSNIAVNGPDEDGLLWVIFGVNPGPKVALSVKAESLAGRALSLWRDERNDALAKARGEPS